MPESPRWLLANGRLDDLCLLVERVARINKRILPTNYRKYLEAVTQTTEHNTNDSLINWENGSRKMSSKFAGIQCGASPIRLLFSRKYCKTSLLTFITWLTLIIVYFGLTLHLSNFGGNIYLNTVSWKPL